MSVIQPIIKVVVLTYLSIQKKYGNTKAKNDSLATHAGYTINIACMRMK